MSGKKIFKKFVKAFEEVGENLPINPVKVLKQDIKRAKKIKKGVEKVIDRVDALKETIEND